MPDSDLMASARAGDDRAFDLLFQRYYAKVAGLAARLHGNMEDAEDIAQTAFVRAHANLARIRDGQALLAWLYRTVVNEIRDRAKAKKRKPLFLLGDLARGEDGPEAAALAEPGDRELDPARIVARSERDSALERAIGGLPLEFREPVVMHHIEQMDLGEIAGALGVPVGTVKSRLSRGRARLREALAEWFEQ
ncbi:MAG: sigma-70 family RNA polymerase sigma factor [Armatimonadetes bacterium]|nr:sigma-70 family RNA polymerase sigma factor [Armatimonadota bacterium]